MKTKKDCIIESIVMDYNPILDGIDSLFSDVISCHKYWVFTVQTY